MFHRAAYGAPTRNQSCLRNDSAQRRGKLLMQKWMRPGGIFRTTMQSPEGQEFPNTGCYLEAVKNERIVWTNAMLPGFRPAPINAPCGDEAAEFMFTAFIEMMPHGTNGTLYRATVVHANEAGCKTHASMGFEGGWSAALDQLVAMVKKGI
jgi:uncharacterized protein YndB with AHSA1/START domain